MRKMLFILAFSLFTTANAAPPDFFMGHYKAKLPDMKKAAALALKNPACRSVATGLYIPAGQQRYPGKAYLITCNAPSRPGGTMDIYISDRQIHQGQTPQPIQPATIAQARRHCIQAFKMRYSPDADVKVQHISDDGTANRRVDAVVAFKGYTGSAYCLVTPKGKTETHLTP